MKKIKVYIATFTLFFSLYAIGVPCEPNVINLIGTFTVPGIDPSPSDVAFSPNGKLLATANIFTGSVTTFQVTPDGDLTAAKIFTLDSGTFHLEFSPNGKF